MTQLEMSRKGGLKRSPAKARAGRLNLIKARFTLAKIRKYNGQHKAKD